MSYARFANDSSVYVFLSVYGEFECCACCLRHDESFYSTDAILAHLAEHKAEGHRIPDRTLERLEADREENDAFIRGGGA